MMMMMRRRLTALSLARSSMELHTIISKETIKPSSPTPTHLKTYNLSLLDQQLASIYMPFVFFFPRTDSNATTSHQEKAAQLKKSLSQTLTQYYPFSGRLVNSGHDAGAYVDCNDEGVEFVEARVDSQLSEVVHLLCVDHQPLDQLFPHPVGLLCVTSSTRLVMVQLTHFVCGGLALAVSLSHKVGDGCTLLYFIKHWADVTHNIVQAEAGAEAEALAQALPPHFISYPRGPIPAADITTITKQVNNFVTKKFVFPNSNLAKLKAKAEMMNPTRVEVLNSLLHGCAVKAANPAGITVATPFFLINLVNVRSRMAKPLPETTVGNILSSICIPTVKESELEMNSLPARIKNAKMQLTDLTDVKMNQIATENSKVYETLSNDDVKAFVCTSTCGFPLYQVDFGWGKPVRATIAWPVATNSFMLMDTPSGDGIEALVTLEEEDMARFQNDEQLLTFVL